jgi:hypothetical protein
MLKRFIIFSLRKNLKRIKNKKNETKIIEVIFEQKRTK